MVMTWLGNVNRYMLRAMHWYESFICVQKLSEFPCSNRIARSLWCNYHQGWVSSRSQIVSQNLRSICDKHTIKLRLVKRVTGKDRKALVIHTHAQRTRSIYDDIPTLRVPDGCRRMLAVYERNQR